MSFAKIYPGKAADHASENRIYAQGEMTINSFIAGGVETEDLRVKYGNGKDHWNDLTYWDGFGDDQTIRIGIGQEYETISEAMDAIADASIDKIYTLRLTQSYKRSPNRWDTFLWKPFIQVEPDGGSLRHKGNILKASNEFGSGYDFDKAFQGIDFNDCVANVWAPFQQPMSGIILNSLGITVDTWADEATKLASGVLDGTIGLVIDSGDGTAKMYILHGDSAVPGDWTDITTHAEGLNLVGAIMPGISAVGSNLTNARCDSVRMPFAKFDYSVLPSANFSYSDLSQASFRNADLTGVQFKRSFMTLADLSYAIMLGTDLSGVQAFQLSVGGADWTGGICRDSIIHEGDFGGANMTEVVATGADFSNSNFFLADLTSMYVSGANFTGCTLPSNADTKVEFKALVGAWDAVTTIWTDGLPIG